MQIVIDIPKDTYKDIIESGFIERGFIWDEDKEIVVRAVKNGTPLPKGHGRLIDADALEKKMCDREIEIGEDRALWESSAVQVALDMFAPTIIEADKIEREKNKR